MYEETLSLKAFHVLFAVTRRLQSGRERRKTQTVCSLSLFSQECCAEAVSMNLSVKPARRRGSSHKPLDKAGHCQEAVK